MTLNVGPGSFLEATKLIPLLMKEDEGPAFDVVVPSLPNFGFSQAVPKVKSRRQGMETRWILTMPSRGALA